MPRTKQLLAVGVLACGLWMYTGCDTGFGGENDSCVHAFDGQCDDGRPCSDSFLCFAGTDASDCDGVSADSCSTGDSCIFAFDGVCDDGGPGSETDSCGPGTDDSDCGF